MVDLNDLNLDPNVKEQSEYTVIPEGNYNAVIIQDKLVNTKAGTGKLLELKWQIVDGEFKNETIIDRLNIMNQSLEAQKIGQGQLKRICTLCNVVYPPQNTQGLIGKPVSIRIKHETFTSNTTGNELTSMKVSGYSPAKQEQPKSGPTTNDGGGW